MNRNRVLAAAALAIVATCGCQSAPRAATGAGLGGLLGAGAGALIGRSTGHTTGGALIGAGAGALSGGLVGHAIDESERKSEVRLAAATAPAPHERLSAADVARLAESGVGDEVVIDQIRATGSVFRLSADDIIGLKREGVSDAVLREMLSTTDTPVPAYRPSARTVYVAEPEVYHVHYGFGHGYGCGW